MAVSPRETMVGRREYCWRGLVCASLLLMAVVCGAASAPEPRFFRIGTAATGGSFFEIGGVVAGAISGPAGGPACEELKTGDIDAFFLVGGSPIPAIRDLAATIPIRLIPLEGELVDRLKHDFTFYHRAVIPAGTYPGVDVETATLGFYALWLA